MALGGGWKKEVLEIVEFIIYTCLYSLRSLLLVYYIKKNPKLRKSPKLKGNFFSFTKLQKRAKRKMKKTKEAKAQEPRLTQNFLTVVKCIKEGVGGGRGAAL